MTASWSFGPPCAADTERNYHIGRSTQNLTFEVVALLLHDGERVKYLGTQVIH